MKIPWSEGVNTARDPTELAVGQLVRATGVYYKPGDTRPHRIGGVAEFADLLTASKVDGIALLQFDEGGNDRLVCLSNGTLYGVDLTGTGLSGAASAIHTGITAGAPALSAAHFDDRWYIALGSENIVIEADGTVRAMGMQPPIQAPTVTTGTGSTLTRPDESSGNFTNPSFAYDSDVASFAHAGADSPSTIKETYRWKNTSDTGTDRRVWVRWALAGIQILPDFPSDGAFDDVGGTYDSGFDVDVKFEVSEDGGGTFTEITNRTNIKQARGQSVASFDVTDGLELQSNFECRVTLKYNDGGNVAVLRILDVNVSSGSSTAAFSTEVGLYYALAEYDEKRDLTSEAIASDLVVMSSEVFAKVSWAQSARNATTTHWRVYRTNDGGGLPQDLGLVGEVPVSQQNFVDTFEVYNKDAKPKPVYRLLRLLIQQDSGAVSPLFFPFDTPPRRFAKIRSYDGSLVGFSDDEPRRLFFSAGGFPESFPEINVIKNFVFEGHDRLLDGVELGQLFIVGAQGAMFRLAGLPRVVGNIARNSNDGEKIKAAPGCVGRDAMAAFSVSGAPAVAWISQVGIHVTDGSRVAPMSSSINWKPYDGRDKSGWILHWDGNRQVLVFQPDGEYWLLHVHPDHQQRVDETDREEPKWTGPHPGTYTGLASGEVGDTHRIYAGHKSDGKIYVLNHGTSDESKAYDGTDKHPMICKTGRYTPEEFEWSVIDGWMPHSNFGSGEQGTLRWTSGEDNSEEQVTIENPVPLDGSKKEQLDFQIAQQWAEVEFEYFGSGMGSIGDLDVRILRMGRSGSRRAS